VRQSNRTQTGPREQLERGRVTILKRFSGVSGLVSIVGQVTNEELPDVDAPAPRARTEDAAWYAAQAASLNARLEADEANVRDFTRALEDARDLKTTTLGINLAEDNIGLTPEATIEILQSRVRETQSEIDALEDLARHDGIPQEFCVVSGRVLW
jgi:hypothetical protein